MLATQGYFLLLVLVKHRKFGDAFFVLSFWEKISLSDLFFFFKVSDLTVYSNHTTGNRQVSVIECRLYMPFFFKYFLYTVTKREINKFTAKLLINQRE